MPRCRRAAFRPPTRRSARWRGSAALRYGNNDYFWINDMHPKMVMHPIKPEMNGNDLSAYKDPNGKLLFVDFVDTVKKERLRLRSL